MSPVVLLLALACGPDTTAPRTGGKGVRTWLEDPGVLVVQVEADADAQVEIPEPEVRGLTFQAQGEPRIERVGEHTVLTQKWSYSGASGIYEVPALVAPYAGPDGEGTLRGRPLWIDLDVAPPREGALADIVDPPRAFRPPGWLEVGIAGSVALATVAGLRMLWVAARRPTVAEMPREPAHVRALKAWEAVRHDPTVDDHDKTIALSRIFREYMEEVLRFPATAWTTTETLAHLQGLSFLPEGNVPRAKRLLRATDRVKFADAATRAELFAELDADLRAFLDSTRPRSWEVEAAS